MKETSEKLILKSDLLRENKVAKNNWPDESFFSMKDSTLKKNTAFVKKIVSIWSAYIFPNSEILSKVQRSLFSKISMDLIFRSTWLK